MMLSIFLFLLQLTGSFCTIIGGLTVFYWLKAPKAPADSSNRINNITSWWIGLTRPEVLAHSYEAFRQDVMENVEEVEDNPD